MLEHCGITFSWGTEFGKGGPILAAKIGPGGTLLVADRFFRYRTKNRKSPRWFTPEIRHLLNCLRSLHKRYKTHPTQNNLNCIKSVKSHLQQKISNAKTDDKQTLINSYSNNTSKLLQYFNT